MSLYSQKNENNLLNNWSHGSRLIDERLRTKFRKTNENKRQFKKNTKKNTWREKLDLLTCSWMKFRFCYVIDATNERIPYTKLKKGGDGKLGWKRNVDRVIFLYDTGIDNFLPFEEDERNFVFTRRRRMNWLSVSRSRGPLLFFFTILCFLLPKLLLYRRFVLLLLYFMLLPPKRG